eukprot:6178289-Pleurochrysis_carterae.AAC.1
MLCVVVRSQQPPSRNAERRAHDAFAHLEIPAAVTQEHSKASLHARHPPSRPQRRQDSLRGQ